MGRAGHLLLVPLGSTHCDPLGFGMNITRDLDVTIPEGGVPMRKAYMTPEELRASLSKLPRISLANLPTPLEECTRLSRAVSQTGDGARILIKRDDLTGQALGGNKVRHLELRIADALAKGCDTYIYVGGDNESRSTAAACAKAGMRCVILERGRPPLQGNFLLCQLLGAEIVYLDEEPQEASPDRTVAGKREPTPPLEEIGALADRLREEGHVPYSDHLLAFRPVSSVCSYLLATLDSFVKTRFEEVPAI